MTIQHSLNSYWHWIVFIERHPIPAPLPRACQLLLLSKALHKQTWKSTSLLHVQRERQTVREAKRLTSEWTLRQRRKPHLRLSRPQKQHTFGSAFSPSILALMGFNSPSRQQIGTSLDNAHSGHRLVIWSFTDSDSHRIPQAAENVRYLLTSTSGVFYTRKSCWNFFPVISPPLTRTLLLHSFLLSPSKATLSNNFPL